MSDLGVDNVMESVDRLKAGFVGLEWVVQDLKAKGVQDDGS